MWSRLGIRNMYLWHLLEVIHSVTQEMQGLWVGTGTVKFLWIILWALSSESKAVYSKLDLPLKNKTHTHTHTHTQNPKGVENFMLKKRDPQ
jgi:hypothetical protein